MRTAFTILGVPESADDQEVKTAYLRAVKRHPPDADPQGFEAVRTAFEQIATRRQRLAYVLFSHEPPETLDILEHYLKSDHPGRPGLELMQQLIRGKHRKAVGESGK